VFARYEALSANGQEEAEVHVAAMWADPDGQVLPYQTKTGQEARDGS